MNKFIKIFILLAYILAHQLLGEKMETVKTVSMIQLIANPDKYDKQYIQVIGYLLLEYERTVLYTSSLDYEHSISHNAIQLKIPDMEIYSKENKKYVLIEGIFNMKTYGRRGLMYSGSIEKINRLILWEKEK